MNSKPFILVFLFFLPYSWLPAQVDEKIRLIVRVDDMGCSYETRALFKKLGKEYGLDVFLEDHEVKKYARHWR